MPDWLKFFLIKLIYRVQIVLSFFYRKPVKEYVNGKKNIFVLLSTDYSNLGDHALTYSHIKYIEREFPEANIVEILVSDTLSHLYSIRELISEGDILTLKGGGNIGIEYFREELYRRKIITTFCDNKVIIFPQTIYFPDTKFGVKQKNITFDIFKSASNLILATRDHFSFEQVENIMGKRVVLTPDIVLSLPIENNNLKRNGALTAMRDDIEGVLSAQEKNKLYDIIKANYKSFIISDTTTDYPISIEMRESELKKIWFDFGSAELVITDRLHGMIFAYLTGTPCIVLKTYNHKVIGQYKWLENSDNIMMVDSISEVKVAIESLSKAKSVDLSLNSEFGFFRNMLD
ncbi:polysaccharide pyruvyl transferase family protein [Vibrio splendidus]